MDKMDFSRFRMVLDTSENGTPTNLTNLPSNVLEAFIPGYGPISKFILDASGFDVGIVVSIGFILFAVITSATYVWNKAFSFFSQSFMSSVFVDDGDDLFDSVLQWIAEQRMSKISRSVKAVTRLGTIYGDQGDDSDEEEALDEKGIFNFGKWAAKLPPRYEPYFGKHRFWHNGRLFIFDRSRRERPASPWSPNRGDEELIELRCIGRSTKPIKNLLNYIKSWSLEKEKAMTVIRRPAGKDRGRSAGSWDRVSSRPSRPMDTVSLDPEQKAKVVEDINEYLHPSSPRWYATRGIPYRRGYLFHGPPGTGKTSLSFALAGIFGLDIFCISLLEPTLTESDLNRLFNNLPRRCIVLLEDIDTAGLLRDEKSDKEEEDEADSKGDKIVQELNVTDLAKAIKSANRKDKQNDDVKQGVSLSGLLNAIDGVATHEGRVLVMTTNHPERLDEALIRPGRVDMQVEFTLATRDQIRDIFIRMYSIENDKVPKQRSRPGLMNGVLKPTSNGSLNGSAKMVNGTNGINNTNGINEINGVNGVKGGKYLASSDPAMAGTMSPERLRALAEAFAGHIPEGKFSPAEIQGFLLTRKKEPQRALEQADEWKDTVLEAKEKKAKVVGVQ